MKKHVGRPLLNCQEFTDVVRNVAEDRINDLPYDTDLTAEDICGEGAWSLLSQGEQKLAGKCMKLLVNDNVLPLDPVVGIHEYPLLYRRR
jgi:hypothetical protein